MASGSTEDPLENADLNFKFERLERPWVQLNAKLHNPAATLMFQNRQEKSLFILIAEKLGMDSEVTVESLTDIVQSTLAGQLGKFDFETSETREVNGLNYTTFKARVKD